MCTDSFHSKRNALKMYWIFVLVEKVHETDQVAERNPFTHLTVI